MAIPNTKYTFICEQTDEEGLITSTVKSITLSPETTWSGSDGPLHNFYLFLKGCGYIFDINDEIGVMNNDTGNFRGVFEWE